MWWILHFSFAGICSESLNLYAFPLTFCSLLKVIATTFRCFRTAIRLMLPNSFNQLIRSKAAWINNRIRNSYSHGKFSFLGKSALPILHLSHQPCFSLLACVCVCMCACVCLCVYVCECVRTVRATSLCKCMIPDSYNSYIITCIESSIQSNGASCVFLLNDLEFHLQGPSVGISLYLRMPRKWWEIEQTLLLPIDRKSCICRQIATWWILYIVTLTYIFKVTHFEMWISRQRRKMAKIFRATIWRLVFASRWDHCEWCSPWRWPSFARSTIVFIVHLL